jgi:predicted ATPase/DNA-binding SARP family transcriptional activator
MFSRLVLQFLGLPQISLNDQPVVTERRKAIALLAYLSVNDIGHPGQRYTRESLSALLWPDYEQAKAFSNLRRTIWEVHQAIGENWLVAERESVRLSAEAGIDLDVARFRDLLSESRQQTDISLRVPFLVDAVKLYRNHFLTGFSLKDAHPFNDWAFAESEELRHKLADALILLSDDYCAFGQAEKAIPHARRLTALEPLNEAAHRKLMEVYLGAGQHGLALKQYQTCEQILRKELNLDPQPETRALYKKIRKREINSIPIEKQIEPTTPKHNLPAQLSTFIGREKEQDEIINLLAKNRLVTLAGVGGIGKTRLSLQVGEKLLKDFPHGVWFVPLDSLSDPALVPSTVAAVFDIREGSSDQPIIERLSYALRQKTTLLIFDNCEHLLDACAHLSKTLLRNCPNLKILATSREVLNMEGEATYYLSSLSIADDKTALETLTDYESIRLFVERASLALSSFQLTKENAQTIIGLCRKVDGIPLAIELAAARVNILNVEEILQQLDNSFALLARDSRTALPRHQTLRASIDWSWGLLSNQEQRFMGQLTVFAGSWTLDAAQAVCEGNTLDLTSALVKKSLIMVDQKLAGETRYHFHEIIRQYAYEKLGDASEEENTRSRHLKFFLHFTEQAEAALRGPTQIEWHARLNAERSNLRAALAWADKTDVEAGLYISSRLGRFWLGYDMREAGYWLSTFLQKPESHSYPRARAMALRAHMPVLNYLSQNDTWRSTAKEYSELYRALGDQGAEIDVLLITAREISSAAQRMKLFQKALNLAQASGDIWREASVLYEVGWHYSGNERLNYWGQGITLFRQAGDWRSLAQVLSATANFALLNDNLELAQKYLVEATSLNDQLKDKDTMFELLSIRAKIAMMRGDYNQAHTYLHEGLDISEELGARMSSLWLQSYLGYLALREHNLTEARDIFTETARELFIDKDEIGVVFNLEGMAGLFVAITKPKNAARLIGWADATRKRIDDTRPRLEQADVDKIIAACLAKMGEVAFSNAYEQGQKMTLDEAVAYALSEN